MNDTPEHECIDPGLGEQLWRLDDPATGAALRRRLQTHVRFCDACREERQFAEMVAADVASGAVSLSGGRARSPRAGPWLLGGGALAMAAALLVILIATPRAPEPLLRGEPARPRILQPVPDQVVLGGTPDLAWSAMPGAREYVVTVTAVGGGSRWTARTETPGVAIPDGAALAVGQRYRIAVVPVPADVGPRGGLRGSFHTGGVLAVARDRLARAPAAILALGALGLLAMVGGAVLWRNRRSSS